MPSLDRHPDARQDPLLLRTRGLFAGITLKGSTIRQDRDANERFYGRAYRTTEIVLDRLGGAPDPVPAWRDELARAIQ